MRSNSQRGLKARTTGLILERPSNVRPAMAPLVGEMLGAYSSIRRPARITRKT